MVSESPFTMTIDRGLGWVGVLIPSKVAGNPSNRVKSPSNSETSKWERSQQLVPSKGAGKLVLVLGAKWERLGVKILVVPSTSAGNQMGNGWGHMGTKWEPKRESKIRWFPAPLLGTRWEPNGNHMGTFEQVPSTTETST